MGASRLRVDQPARYRIQVQGHVSNDWSDRFGDLEITQQAVKPGISVTTMHVQLADQAALLGILMALYDARLPLLSVQYLP